MVGASRWRWLLRTEDGEPLASHQVELDTGSFLYRGFADLYRFLRWEAEPDERLPSEARLIEQVGEWITEHALGREVVEELLAEAPATVRVQADHWPRRPEHQHTLHCKLDNPPTPRRRRQVGGSKRG